MPGIVRRPWEVSHGRNRHAFLTAWKLQPSRIFTICWKTLDAMKKIKESKRVVECFRWENPSLIKVKGQLMLNRRGYEPFGYLGELQAEGTAGAKALRQSGLRSLRNNEVWPEGSEPGW